SGGLIDDAQNLEASDFAGILGRLTLRVVEISRNGDDSLLDLLPEIGFGRLFHFLQDEGRDLGWRKGLAVGLDPCVAVGSLADLVRDKLLVLFDHRIVVAPSYEALDREDRLFGIGDRLALCRLTDETFAVVGERYNRRRRAHAFGVLDNFRRLAFHDGDARIGGAEVDADDLAHGSSSQIAAGRPGHLAPEWECQRLIRRPPIQPLDTRFAAFLRLNGSYRRARGGRKSVSHEIASLRARGLINGYQAIAVARQPG